MRFTKSLHGVLLAGFLVPQTVQPTGHIHGDPVERREILLPTKDFIDDTVQMQFRQILSTKNRDTKILFVEALDNENSSNLSEMGVDGATYEFWEVLYSDYKSVIPPFAELLVIGENAAMRLRDNRGKISIKVLEGDNPYDVRACGESFALAHLTVKTLHSEGKPMKAPTRLHFFLTTNGAVGERITRCVCEELQRRFSIAAVRVSLRNDPWFLLNSDYPVVLPFAAENRPPTKEEYESAPQSYCGQYNGQVVCFREPKDHPAAPDSMRQ